MIFTKTEGHIHCVFIYIRFIRLALLCLFQRGKVPISLENKLRYTIEISIDTDTHTQRIFFDNQRIDDKRKQPEKRKIPDTRRERNFKHSFVQTILVILIDERDGQDAPYVFLRLCPEQCTDQPKAKNFLTDGEVNEDG
jgi:hypothetical protein